VYEHLAPAPAFLIARCWTKTALHCTLYGVRHVCCLIAGCVCDAAWSTFKLRYGRPCFSGPRCGVLVLTVHVRQHHCSAACPVNCAHVARVKADLGGKWWRVGSGVGVHARCTARGCPRNVLCSSRSSRSIVRPPRQNHATVTLYRLCTAAHGSKRQPLERTRGVYKGLCTRAVIRARTGIYSVRSQCLPRFLWF